MALAISLVITILYYELSPLADSLIMEVGMSIGWFTDSSFFVVIVGVTLLYERPIRKVLRRLRTNGSIDPDLMSKARQRLLNEPYYLIAADFLLWVLIGSVYIVALVRSGLDPGTAAFRGIEIFMDALITSTAAFFLLQMVLQKRLAPIFFPNGGLSRISKTRHIRLRARLLALLLAVSIIPLFSIILTHWAVIAAPARERSAGEILADLHAVVIFQSFFFMGISLVLTLLVAGNLRRPLNQILEVLNKVRSGIFQNKVKVTSNDEIGYVGDSINQMTEGLIERDLIKDTFGKYVAREVRDEVMSGKVPLDGEIKQVTVLFADLRDFTPMTETTEPKRLVRMMNRYFKEMAEAIQEQEGLVLQFIGDEIYAVFGAPLALEDHPARAFRAGLNMQKRLQELNLALDAEGYPQLQHGIGIHTGQVLAANIGSPDRLSYLLVGDTVNLASRLQGLTREIGTEMVLSAATYNRLPSEDLKDIQLKKLESVRVKGRQNPVEAYSLEAI